MNNQPKPMDQDRELVGGLTLRKMPAEPAPVAQPAENAPVGTVTPIATGLAPPKFRRKHPSQRLQFYRQLPCATAKNGEVARHVLGRRYLPGQIIELRVPNAHRWRERGCLRRTLQRSQRLAPRHRASCKENGCGCHLHGFAGDQRKRRVSADRHEHAWKEPSGCRRKRDRRATVGCSDVDTVRPKEFTKASSTDAEKACGRACADSVRSFFTSWESRGT